MFILPCGCKAELKEKYKKIADELGICSVYFTITGIYILVSLEPKSIASLFILKYLFKHFFDERHWHTDHVGITAGSRDGRR